MRKLLIVPISFCLLVGVLGSDAWAGVNGWDHVGNGGSATTPSLDGSVYALHADGTDLYVGGTFTHAGGVPATHLARWDGSQWSGFTGLNGDVHAIAVANGKVYVGGVFTNAGGDPNADFLAVWNGSNWASFCSSTGGPPITASVQALQVLGNTLYIGGSFANGGGLAAADFLVGCDLTTGAASSTVASDGGMTGSVLALTAAGGTLYAGGAFINVGGNLAIDHVGAYDGSWHSMGTGPSPGGGPIDSFVRSLASDGTNVYVGSDSLNIGGVAAADHVAKWNGSAWSAMGSSYFSTTTFIYALAVSGPFVFAGGSFQNESGDPLADQIVYWDGVSWHHLGSNGAGNGPYIGTTDALATVGTRVYTGGNFTSAGGDTLAEGIARSPIQQPDAQIGTSATGPFTGNGIYSATASKESLSINVQRGRHGTFYMKFANDGLTASTYLLQATGHAKGYTTTYTVGTTDVTAQIKAGTYSTLLFSGGSITMKLVVNVANSAGNSASFLVDAAETSVPTDAVKAVVKAK